VVAKLTNFINEFFSKDTKSSFRFINKTMQKTELVYTGGFMSLAVVTVFFNVITPMVKFLKSVVNNWELPFNVK
jgi:hypothetical protein